MASVKELLIAARAKIEKPENWTQHVFARVRQHGYSVEPKHPEATCWCTIGALRSVNNYDTMQFYSAAWSLLQNELDSSLHTITYFNDNHTHEEVLALFDRAISNAD